MSLPAFFDLYIDEEVRTRYREEGKAEGRAEGRAEGKAEGRAEGRLEGERLQAFATARKLLQMGLEDHYTAYYNTTIECNAPTN